MMPRRKRRLSSRLRDCLRNLLAFLFSNLGVILLVVAYTIAGAFTFQTIEGESEMQRASLMALERERTAQYMWQNVTLAFNLFNETALKDRISAELAQYQRKVVVAVRHGWDGGRSSRQWSFSSAFLYSLTVITTIGYGHLSPRTSWGKIVTILYALLGMPLFLLYLSNVGELLARWFKCLYALVCLCQGCPGFTRRRLVRMPIQVDVSEVESIERPEDWSDHGGGGPGRVDGSSLGRDIPSRLHPRLYYHHNQRIPYEAGYPISQARGRHGTPPRSRASDVTSTTTTTSDFSYITFDAQTVTVPISVCVAIMVGYILFGSMLFGLWENWDRLDGAYFSFISLSSIGFGDFVPGERVFTPRIETSFIACSLYLMLGMALVAMCFNLMQEQVIHYFAGLRRAFSRVCRCNR